VGKRGQFSTGIFILTLIVLVSSNLTYAETYTEWISEGDRRLYEHGNYSGAIEAYDKAIDIEPDNPQLKENKRIAVNRNETEEIKIRKPASKTTGIIGLIFLFTSPSITPLFLH
jgi:tetratricopeptide (TPR) repeat protein